MRNDKTEWMDHLISEEMHRTADPLAPSPALKSRIEDALAAEKISPVRKGAYSMKRIPKLIVVAAACMMLAAGVYAIRLSCLHGPEKSGEPCRLCRQGS